MILTRQTAGKEVRYNGGNRKLDLLEYLKKNQLVTDGAMGTYYGEKFQKTGKHPELANITHPERILQIHEEYIKAGAEFIRTNSFTSNLQTLFGAVHTEETGRSERLRMLSDNVAASYKIAQQAVAESGKKVLIAGDIGPIPEQGIRTSEFYGSAMREEEELLEEYKVIADALMDAGAEILLFETFSDYRYILPVAAYAKGKKDVLVMASFCLTKFGYTRSGLSAEGILKVAAEESVIDGVGFNCGIGSTHMNQIVKRLDFSDLLVAVVPNSGYPDIMTNRSGYQENAAYFCENMKEVAALGVNLIGGCCGTTPAYIQKLAEHKSRKRPKRAKNNSITTYGTQIQKEKNKFYQILHSSKKPVIVELDPPHDGNSDKIIQASILLKQAGVDMITFSDSPMGKMRADSMMTGAKMQRELEISVMPHVTCRDKNRLGMGAALLGAHMNAIRSLLLVTGDPVNQGDRSGVTPVFDFNSIKLMEYTKQMNLEYFPEDPFLYGGALNYGRANLDNEIKRMRQKCAAGADYFMTQPIYGDWDVERISYIKERLDTKIMCGIMPLVSYRNAMFMKNEVFGIHIPDEIVFRYQKEMSREEGEATGIEISLEIVEKLDKVADGYYFMVPFNRAAMICRIMERMEEKCLI